MPSIIYLSYADIDNFDGGITQFAQRLEKELQVLTGEECRIIRDFENVRRGSVHQFWLQNATFFIACLSPSYFRSEVTRLEMDIALQRERLGGVPDLILPVYVVGAPAVTHEIFSRPVVFDFREIRLEGWDSARGQTLVKVLAAEIARRFEGGSSAAAKEEFWTINSISLRNFRCFDQVRIELRSESSLQGDWTCLAGINGAGKSSVLQAIAIGMLGAKASDLQSGMLARMARRVGSRPQTAEIKFEATERRSGIITQYQVSITGKGAVRTLYPPLAEMSVVVGYGATRNLATEQDAVVKNMGPEAQRTAGLFYPLSKMATAEVLLSERRQNESFAPLFGELLRRVFDDQITMRGGSNNFRVAGGEWVDPLDLPDGFRSSAAWMADLCAHWCDTHAKQAKSGDPSEIEAIVLIDEIDLHLHPKLQRELVPRLRKTLPKVQWVVTTHSPLVLANFDANEIIALDRNAEGNIRPLDRQIMGFTSDEIYQWLMGTSPTGAAVEQVIREADDSVKKQELAELMRVSPETSHEEAQRQVAEFQDILKSLKPKE